MRITPSSIFVRPIFHWSATRMPNCAMSSGWVVGTISTAIWLPFCASNAASLLSSEATWSALNVAVRSVTRRVNSGTATWAQAVSAQSSRRKPDAICARNSRLIRRSVAGCGRRGRRAEIDRGRPGDGLLVFHREARLGLVAEHHRGEVGGEGTHRDVVRLDRGDVAVARDGDAVLGAFELRLQVAEQAVCLQLRVVLRAQQQTRDRAGERALRGDELLERGFVVDELGRRLDRADACTRFGH